jgi:hypothetical protein
MAHTFDTSAQLVAQTGTSISLSYTAGAGATLLVLGIAIITTTARAGGAPSYAGITMSQAGTAQISGGSAAQTELWYLINPPVGSANNIVVPNTGALNVTLVASTYKAAPGLTSILDVSAQATNSGGGSTNPTVSLTTTAPGCAVVSIIDDAGGTLTAGQTNLFSGTNSTNRYGGQYALQASAGAISMNWTNATSARWATNAAAFRETSRSNFLLTGIGT